MFLQIMTQSNETDDVAKLSALTKAQDTWLKKDEDKSSRMLDYWYIPYCYCCCILVSVIHVTTTGAIKRAMSLVFIKRARSVRSVCECATYYDVFAWNFCVILAVNVHLAVVIRYTQGLVLLSDFTEMCPSEYGISVEQVTKNIDATNKFYGECRF